MIVDNKYERCAKDDPLRCQAVVANGQCPYKAMPGFSNCVMHGQSHIRADNIKRLSNYRLQQYQERVDEFASNSEIKSLREEIGIMRMTLESLIVSITDKNKLLLYTDKITSMINQIMKLIEAAQRLEERNNTLLDRKVVVLIADSLVTIIAEYVHDPDHLNEIGGKICESIEKAASPAYSGRVTEEGNNGA